MNMSAITLKCGAEIASKERLVVRDKEIEEEVTVQAQTKNSRSSPSLQQEEVRKSDSPPYELEPPFPEALTETHKVERNKDIYETICKCEVNVPFLDALNQVPRHAKFLKEL